VASSKTSGYSQMCITAKKQVHKEAQHHLEQMHILKYSIYF